MKKAYYLSIPVSLRAGASPTAIPVSNTEAGMKLAAWWDTASLAQKNEFIHATEFEKDAAAVFMEKYADPMGYSAGSDVFAVPGGLRTPPSDTGNPNMNLLAPQQDPDYSHKRVRDTESSAERAFTQNETFDQTSSMSTGTTNP